MNSEEEKSYYNGYTEPYRQLLMITVWNCNTKTKFVFSTLTRITDAQQITDAISEALNRKEGEE